jgi:hypothetical protein
VQLEERLQQYVSREEESMKERIRYYAQQQEALFAVKKSRAEKVKDALYRLADHVLRGESVQLPETLLGGTGSSDLPKVSLSKTGVDLDSGRLDDGLFDLDGFESDGQASGESDSEQTDGDGSMADSGMVMRHTPFDSREQPLLATSVPVSVPAFSRAHQEALESDDDLGGDFENIGASIKKLALSVQDSSDTLFGDRPRPRVNSDAGKRWH